MRNQVLLGNLTLSKNCKLLSSFNGVLISCLLFLTFRCERSWKYHFPSETWFREQKQQKKRKPSATDGFIATVDSSPSYYQYFNVKKWEIVVIEQMDFSSCEFISFKEFCQILKCNTYKKLST
jgi:hypothetical protein